ncbi:Myotubularin-related protein 8 [Bienertia sinuspersici]
MERIWIHKSKLGDPEYNARVRQFINFAVKISGGHKKLLCPCHKCYNLLHKRVYEIFNHLTKSAFDNTYTCSIWHREKMDETQMSKPKNSVFKEENIVEGDNLEGMLCVAQDIFNDDPSKFERLLSDFEKPLYPGFTKYSRLKEVLKLYNLKAANGLSDKGFGDMLELFKDMLLEENILPKRTYEAKKTLSTMSLRYEKIHACPNDCMLY